MYKKPLQAEQGLPEAAEQHECRTSQQGHHNTRKTLQGEGEQTIKKFIHITYLSYI